MQRQPGQRMEQTSDTPSAPSRAALRALAEALGRQAARELLRGNDRGDVVGSETHATDERRHG